MGAHKLKQLTQALFYMKRSDRFTANILNGIYKGVVISGIRSQRGVLTGLTNLAERGVGVKILH